MIERIVKLSVFNPVFVNLLFIIVVAAGVLGASKLGPIETWTYHAKDGEVTFLITGDVVRLQATD